VIVQHSRLLAQAAAQFAEQFTFTEGNGPVLHLNEEQRRAFRFTVCPRENKFMALIMGGVCR
jgi:hypothetical protein